MTTWCGHDRGPNDEAESPLVSVIVPTYNYSRYVVSAIDSVKKQDYPNIEIIVIDDGSTDNTSNILSNRMDIQYFYQSNQGLSATRNRGIRLSKGKYIQFLDADDLLGPTSIRKRLEYLEKHPEKSAVICRSAYFTKYTFPEHLAFFHREWRQPEPGAVDLSLCYFNIAPPHAFLVRKSIIDRHSLFFDTNLGACEDYDFWFRLAQTSGLPGMIRTCWVYYRQHTSSMSRCLSNQLKHDAELCKRIFLYACQGNMRFDSHPIGEYYVSMLSASLKTARRLSLIDRDFFLDFLTTHVLKLTDMLIQKEIRESFTVSSLLYFSIARIALYEMHFNEPSMNENNFNKIKMALPPQQSYFLAAVLLGNKHAFILARLIKLDLQFIPLLMKRFLT